MKITSIKQSQNITTFGIKYKPERLERIAYADAYTEKYLDYLREHILSKALSPKELYGGRMSEFELNKYLEKHLPRIVNDKSLSKADLEKLETYSIYKIEGSKNSFRGPRAYSDIAMLQPLKLKLVFADKVVDNVILNQDINKLVDYIKNMQSDNVFIGCILGTNDTDAALLINQYFNPLCRDTKSYPIRGIATLDIFEDICDNLTPEQKKAMSWSQEFEIKLRDKIACEREQYINN